MKKLFLLPLSFAMLLISCQTAVDLESEKALVSESLNQWISAHQNENVDMIETILCDDPDMIIFGTDAQERMMGKDEFIAAQKKFFEETSESKIEIYKTTIKLCKSGNVAWTSCLLNWDILSGGQPLHMEGLRLTSVFEKRNNKWLVVQGHVSVPVSGQAVAY